MGVVLRVVPVLSALGVLCPPDPLVLLVFILGSVSVGSSAEMFASCSLSYFVPNLSSSVLRREAMQTWRSGKWLALRLYLGSSVLLSPSSAIGERGLPSWKGSSCVKTTRRDL
jgi:hypothetical protein